MHNFHSLQHFIFTLLFAMCPLQALASDAVPPNDINSITGAISAREITCQTLISQYLEHIQTYNLDASRGAPINAFVAITPSVLKDAEKLDQHFSSTQSLIGPLHCVPVVLKDNIDTYDSPSSVGTLALLDSQPNKDAFLVRQLRHAGAIILGKTTMDELGNGMIGISGRSGRTGNAYDPMQSPGGSSAGSAAAVAANFAVVGIGSDNSGSVRIPAAFHGLYGMRPSTGLLSQNGIFPRGNLDGIAGPITRTVQDMAIVLSVIATPDENDYKTLEHEVISSYAALLEKEDLQGMQLGIIRKGAGIDPFTDTPPAINILYEIFFEHLRTLGATLTDIMLPDFNIDRQHNMAGEVEEINAYLASFPAPQESYADLCLSQNSQVFGSPPECLKHIEDTPPLYGEAYDEVLSTFE
jgi:amidase